MRRVGARVLRGALAGAVGTLALDASTYVDMALRKRPVSSTPQQTVETLASRLHVPLPDDPAEREARLTGVGAVLGMAAGTSAGAVLALLRPSAAPGGTPATAGVAFVFGMLVGNGPMTLLGVTDPRTWTAGDWWADVVPHLAYATATAGALRVLGDDGAGGQLNQDERRHRT